MVALLSFTERFTLCSVYYGIDGTPLIHPMKVGPATLHFVIGTRLLALRWNGSKLENILIVMRPFSAWEKLWSRVGL
jgi:hypothetical protein